MEDKSLAEIVQAMIENNEVRAQERALSKTEDAVMVGSLLYLVEGLANALEERLVHEALEPLFSEEYLIKRARELLHQVQGSRS